MQLLRRCESSDRYVIQGPLWAAPKWLVRSRAPWLEDDDSMVSDNVVPSGVEVSSLDPKDASAAASAPQDGSVGHSGAHDANLPEVGARLEENDLWVEVFGRAQLPTRFATFTILVFRNSADDKEHVALVRGHVRDQTNLLLRMHSECLTGDVFGSLRCDCREQFEMAMDEVAQSHAGVVLYLRQEGRGIGLGNKVRAYALQDRGLDTYEANEHLGFAPDQRDYRVAAMIVRMLGPQSVQLATNNPRKIFGLRAHGVSIAGRLPMVVATNPHNETYLTTKAESGHILPHLRSELASEPGFELEV